MNYLDIGAANFELPQAWTLFKEHLQPILFEPDKRSYAALSKRGLVVHNIALGHNKERKRFYLTNKAACSSFYRPNRAYLQHFPNLERWDIVGETDVDLVPLDDLNLEAHFIKLDTQGSELDILKGAVRTLTHVLGLEIEVAFQEIYANQPLFDDVKRFLGAQGFEFFDFTTQYRYNRIALNRTGQLAFADALFLRPPERVRNMDAVHIRWYNMICSVYQKHDLIIDAR